MKPYYQDEYCTIYHGDCLKLLPEMPKVDCVITDPQYGVGLGETDNTQARKKNQQPYMSTEDSVDHVRNIAVPAIRLCIERYGRVVATTGNRNMFLYPKPDDWGVWWNPAGTSRGKWGFQLAVTPILYWGKDPKNCQHASSPLRVGRDGTLKNNGHPCPKPLGFVAWLVDRASLAEETILDPFMGSGTTLRAAKDLNRKAIGIEIEEKYCEIAAKRLGQEVLDFQDLSLKGELN